jgi:hypothetical protein
MLAPLFAIAQAALLPAEVKVTPRQLCAVGDMVLRDLPQLVSTRDGQPYLLRESPLLARCAGSRRHLPPGFHWTDRTEAERLRHVEPSPARPYGLIAEVGMPIVHPATLTMRQRIVVPVEYGCPGLCGAGFTVDFEYRARRWRRVGVTPGWVS